MANSISYAKEYINNQGEHLNMFDRYLLCADLVKRPTNINGKTISYDRMSFANYVMGDYNRATGLAQKDLTFERVDKVLSQDKGDTLGLDLADKNEAQIADGIVGVYNFYQVKVEVPTVDKYAFSQFALAGGDANFLALGSTTSSNAYEKLLDAEKIALNKRVKINECICYCSVSFDAKLRQANISKSFFIVGSWNGSVETNIEQIDGMKYVRVPDDTLGCEFIIAHPMSATVIDVLKGAEYKDNVPGKVAWAQIDVRDHFDAWVEPTGGDGIVVALAKPRELTLTENADHSVTVSGIEKDAVVKYGTSTGTHGTTLSGTTIPAPQSTTTFYVIQTLDGTDSDEKSIEVTI